MSPRRLSTILALVGLSERECARLTGYSPGAVRIWTSGRANVPEPVADWLEALYAHQKEHPAPKPPKRRTAA